MLQKPVSSLRSMFESKVTANPISPSPVGRSKQKFVVSAERELDDAGTPSRGSLDLPRRPSPRSACDTGVGVSRPSTYDASLPRPRPPGSSFLQRPVSMNSLSPPQSPPIVTVESPTSLPKLFQQSTSQRSNSPNPSLLSRPLPSPQPPKTPPKLPHRGQNRLVKLKADELSPLKALNNEQEMKPPPRKGSAGQDGVAAKVMPPPINRADKPKMPVKLPVGTRSSSLGPATFPSPKRISPFNTPPSSEDEGPTKADVLSSKQPHNGYQRVSRPSRGILPPPALTSNNDAGNSDLNQRPSRPSKTDARSLGFASKMDNRGNLPEDRPGLPPRRGPERPTGQRIGQSPARLSSASRSATVSGTIHQRIPSIDRSTKQGFMPPPRRVPTLQASQMGNVEHRSAPKSVALAAGSGSLSDVTGTEDLELIENSGNMVSDYPDTSHMNRRPPFHTTGVRGIETDYDARLVDICGQYVCTAGHSIRAWDLLSGQSALNIYPGEKDVKITALSFKPGAKSSEDDARLWIGTNYGELQEVDIVSQTVVHTTAAAHERRTIVEIYRHQNTMWTLDDGGRLCVWSGDPSGLPSLQDIPKSHRVPRGHTVSIIVQDRLWLATGKEIRVFLPGVSDGAAFAVLQTPISQSALGAVTSAAVIDDQRDRVYFGHADGKISIYSTDNFSCMNIINVSVYKVVSLAGVGFHLWAGYNTGMIYVYDIRTQPWTIKKEWVAHYSSPVLDIVVDRSSLWRTGELRVTSIGSDSAIRLWDGTLENDWLEEDMQEHDVDYCAFREISAKVITWNAGATTPTHLRYEEDDSGAFESILQAGPPSDLLVFGFQELVDLEDKKLTAKSLFKASKKKEPAEHEHVGRQYRAWRDYLIRCVEDSMPAEEPYSLVHTSNMIGLFSCVFVKASLRSRIRAVDAAEIKRGMGGLHGNKGALVIRLILDDSSVCLVNCHLAAGQTKTVDRNNDITAILEAALLPPERSETMCRDIYVGGGDGSLILDNEICILNGDLNYRIDTMGRDIVVKAVNARNLSKLLERDQLLVSRRRNPSFRLLAFRESPITFAPTYKYDVGSDSYDTSEKRRAPAWCDRILYRGTGKIKQLDYRRHELRVSDHRPVSAIFKMRIKQTLADEREHAQSQSEQRFARLKEYLAAEAKITYLRDVLGVSPDEAKRLL